MNDFLQALTYAQIKHILINEIERLDIEAMLKRSLIHCHAHNLHSIMLMEIPGRRMRMFVAEPGNTLWLNYPENIQDMQSVAFHPHHCDITIRPTRGELMNWVVAPVQNDRQSAELHHLDKFLYRSQIIDGEIGFIKDGKEWLQSWGRQLFEVDEAYFMAAKTMHTVACRRSEWTAWIVIEGQEDPTYENKCYSYTDVSIEDFRGLYKPMSQEGMMGLLAEAFAQ